MWYNDFYNRLSDWSFSDSSSILAFLGKCLDCVPPEVLVVLFLCCVVLIIGKIYRIIILI